MHLLQRDTNEPACLKHYHHGRDHWNQSTPTPTEKIQIWEKLDQLQNGRCAYCEADIHNSDRHIEHFRQRSRYSQGTFDWTNLFGSCNREDSCGKHKDQCGSYNPDDLIKPDVDDPEHYLLFISDGTICIRNGLTDAEQQRARETLRIFNLNHDRGPLRYRRQQAVAGYIQTAEMLCALAIEYPQEYPAILEDELQAIMHLPFVTAIKHTLLGFQ